MSLQYQYMPRKAVGINDPALLDRKVTLQSPSGSTGTNGEVVPTWAAVATVWASKTFVSGGRMEATDAKHYQALVRWRIRFRTDVMTGWRLVHGKTTYEIIITEELGRRHLLDLTCRAIDQAVSQ